MIITKFEEIVDLNADKIAIKAGECFFTYNELNRFSNRIANKVISYKSNNRDNIKNRLKISLLFEHGSEMIAGLIGTLKANCIYVPLDVNYPLNRLLYILEHSESDIILTQDTHYELAQDLVKQIQREIEIISIDKLEKFSIDSPARVIDTDQPTYILYTSGSTGHPKGVVQNTESILYFIENWGKCYSLENSDRLTLLTSLCHDGAIPDIFASLLNGATLYPFDIKKSTNFADLTQFLLEEGITIWHSVATVFRYFTGALTGEEKFPNLRLIILGGEEVRKDDIKLSRTYFPSAVFANIYGQTESTVNAIWQLSPLEDFNQVIIGNPIGETEIILVDEAGGIVEEMGIGEIVIASNYIAIGYWKDDENSKKVFTHDDEMGRLYWTGDLGRLTPDGSICICGRKDFQVKIRGFRIEPGEIEAVLLKHPLIKEAVIILKEDEKTDNYLCAFIVARDTIASKELKAFLADQVPDYMIPREIVNLSEMPLTMSGKLDRKALSELKIEMNNAMDSGEPCTEKENKMIQIWQEILGYQEINIQSNFFDLGGHSLLVITLISKIHQIFNVELQLKDIFDYPTVKELCSLIKESQISLFSSVQPVEKKESYECTPDQMRMYILNSAEGIGTTYNLPDAIKIEGELDIPRFQSTFQKLIIRHEILRTSYELKDSRLFQRIHRYENIDFKIKIKDARETSRNYEENLSANIKDFVQPFDLNSIPLIRIMLVKLSSYTHILLMDMHHIIGDAGSGGILLKEFVQLYNSEELHPLRLNFRDFSEWQFKMLKSGELERQEQFWVDIFSGEIPVLNLPTNYPRPDSYCFKGEFLLFTFGEEMKGRLMQLVEETNTTLYILLLSIYIILLHKYSNQEDIIIGSIIAGRNHVDLEKILGIFAKTIALRNYPTPQQTFISFLKQVKENTLKAFENQLYPFDQLVERLDIKKDPSRNPLFDAAFLLLPDREKVLNLEAQTGSGLKLSPISFDNQTSMFDLFLMVAEAENEIKAGFQYKTSLFKRETIELMKERYLVLIDDILKNREKTIQELDYLIAIEKEMSDIQEVEFDL